MHEAMTFIEYLVMVVKKLKLTNLSGYSVLAV